MYFIDSILAAYGWAGMALAVLMLTLFGIQLWYYAVAYGRIAAYKNDRRPAILQQTPPV